MAGKMCDLFKKVDGRMKIKIHVLGLMRVPGSQAGDAPCAVAFITMS